MAHLSQLAPHARARAQPVSRHDDAFIAALLSGGDSRIAPDPVSGLNNYLCAPAPSPGVVCLASCTASPVSEAGFAESLGCWRDVGGAPSPSSAQDRARAWQRKVEGEVLAYFGAARLAGARLLPSGTDAVLWTATMLAREAGGRPLTAILPSASETGTGVPLAAACRGFDAGPGFDAPLAVADIRTAHVPLRDADGARRGDDALDAAFARAVRDAPGRAVVYVTHGSKTGLIAPLAPPGGAEVVVDACQMRIAPAAVRAYLERGWPVVVTGSKALGGPPFSGAVLVPHGRFRGAAPDEAVAIGPLLRWVAALDGLRALAEAGDRLPGILTRMTGDVARMLGGLPGVRIVDGPSPTMSAASGWPPTIITFALHDPTGPARLLTADELRPVYRALAAAGILVGQPVGLGRFGGLRLAAGARDVRRGFGDGLERFAEAFARATA